VLSELPKETHESPMLSLDKTKEVSGLADFLGEHTGLLSWKLDGLTVVLTFQGGRLVKAVTRGNGLVGEVITNNAKVFKNIPVTIPYKGELILRGEAVIKYSDFERINGQIEDADAKYKNPRNLCSGSVRQLNNEITAQRNVNFYAFSLVRAQEQGEAVSFHNSMQEQYQFLAAQGFSVVEHCTVTKDSVAQAVSTFEEKIRHFDVPSDGLVLMLDDLEYGRSLGSTAKFPRNGIAFKWADETAETTLKEIEWSPSRTGLINPVAIFEPVELEGTTVSRASVHNVSIVEGLKLGIGDKIEVYKANMIIPQIAENHTKSGNITIPEVCPACGGKTEIRQLNDVRSLYCTNPECVAKKIKKFSLFVSRDALNIEGLSEETLEKLIDKGFIRQYADIFRLARYEDEIVTMYGFGQKSYDKLQQSVDFARTVELHALIYALGIPNIGVANAKMICRAFRYDLNQMISADVETLVDIEGIGEVIAESYHDFFADDKNLKELKELLSELTIAEAEKIEEDSKISGKTFVITGSVTHFANRGEVKALIESKGGKVTGSVTSKTDYLINNDTTSNSSKNKKAKELNIPILSEEEFLQML
jgi:DNA ligase (NAD+)